MTDSTLAPATSRAFPWGVSIGALAAATTKPRHALLPTAPGGLLVRCDLASQAQATQVIETAALSLVDALPHRALETRVGCGELRTASHRLPS